MLKGKLIKKKTLWEKDMYSFTEKDEQIAFNHFNTQLEK
jgi:hypothetical protein